MTPMLRLFRSTLALRNLAVSLTRRLALCFVIPAVVRWWQRQGSWYSLEIESAAGGRPLATFVGVSSVKVQEPPYWPESMAAMEAEDPDADYVAVAVSSVPNCMASSEIGLAILQARLCSTAFMAAGEAVGEAGLAWTTRNPNLGLIVEEMIGLDLIIGFPLIGSDEFEFGPDKVDAFETAIGLGLLFLIADVGEEFCPNAKGKGKT